jgi:putative transposase
MLLSLVYAVVRLLLDVAVLRCHGSTARDLELLALRHEVRVLRRRTQRIAWRPGDRLVLPALSRCPPGPTGLRSRFGPRLSFGGAES